MEDEGESLRMELLQGFIIGSRARKDKAICVATSNEFPIRAVRLLGFHRAKENLISVPSSGPADAIQKTRKERIAVGAIGTPVPDQRKSVGLANGETASGSVGVVVQPARRLEDAPPCLETDVGIRYLVQHQ